MVRIFRFILLKVLSIYNDSEYIEFVRYLTDEKDSETRVIGFYPPIDNFIGPGEYILYIFFIDLFDSHSFL